MRSSWLSSSPAIGSSVDRGCEVSLLERGKAARHRRDKRAGRIAKLTRERVDLLLMRLDRRILAGHDLGERDVVVAKRRPGARQRGTCDVVDRGPRIGNAVVHGERP